MGDHSDLDIHVMLREMNMDPNEVAQKLLNQGYWFLCFEQILFFVCLVLLGVYNKSVFV